MGDRPRCLEEDAEGQEEQRTEPEVLAGFGGWEIKLSEQIEGR